MSKSRQLHINQSEILRILEENKDNPLTMEEIMLELGLSSTSLVYHHITQLEKKGYLKRNPSNPKDYQILSDSEKPISYLNMYGLAKCGPDGINLDGDPVERIPIASKLVPCAVSDACLVLAYGKSMEPKIHEGDYIIVKKQNNADNGDVVICTLNNKTIVKRILKQKTVKLLESFNKDDQPVPIIIDEKDDFKINGIMVGLICSHAN